MEKKMKLKQIAKDIQEIFEQHELDYEWQVEDNGLVSVNVEYGDWKHDHAYLVYVMKENRYREIMEQITETDGSDCYSSIHKFSHEA